MRTNSKDNEARWAWDLRVRACTFRTIADALGVSVDQARTLCGRGQRLEAKASAADRQINRQAKPKRKTAPAQPDLFGS